MENAVIQHTFLKRFSLKTSQTQIKQKNPRSREKTAMATLNVG